MRDRTVITPLDPAHYVRTPWKNGGGVTVDIAFDEASRGEVWRFSRTPITTAGPFSDYTGFDRHQMLISGSGLVLQTPDGEIDVRRPFRPVRFDGAASIVSRLETGPVEVINLMGLRSRVQLALTVLDAGRTHSLGPGLHIAYCPHGQAVLELQGSDHVLPADGGLRIEDMDGTAACRAGLVVWGSVTCVSRS
jgi:environmental stress-induced protein Ves